MVAVERFVWIKCLGLPLHAWKLEYFQSFGNLWGTFVSLDDSTSRKKRLAVGRFLISTPMMENISKILSIKINGALYNVKFVEEESSNSLYVMKSDFQINDRSEKGEDESTEDSDDMDHCWFGQDPEQNSDGEKDDDMAAQGFVLEIDVEDNAGFPDVVERPSNNTSTDEEREDEASMAQGATDLPDKAKGHTMGNLEDLTSKHLICGGLEDEERQKSAEMDVSSVNFGEGNIFKQGAIEEDSRETNSNPATVKGTYIVKALLMKNETSIRLVRPNTIARSTKQKKKDSRHVRLREVDSFWQDLDSDAGESPEWATTGDGFLGIQGLWGPNAYPCLLCNVYSVCDLVRKRLLWRELEQVWSKSHLQEVDRKIEESREEINRLDSKGETCCLTTKDITLRSSHYTELLKNMQLKEEMAQQKAKKIWLKARDASTSYFHKCIKGRWRRNEINAISIEGKEFKQVDDIKQGIMKYLANLFTDEGWPRPILEGLNFKTLSEIDKCMLTEPFTKEEVKEAVGNCDSNKALGPNGFNFGFLKNQWEGRQLVDGVVVANETIDGVRKSKTQGFIFKIDFEKATEGNIWTIKCIMRAFKLVSGLKVNYRKSSLIGVNTDEEWLRKMAWLLNCKIGSHPCKYLGVPLGANPSRIDTWKPLIETFSRKLSVWKGRYLSLDGRITLINFVLSSLPVFLMLRKVERLHGWHGIRLIGGEKGLWSRVLMEKYGGKEGNCFAWMREGWGIGSSWWKDVCKLNVDIGSKDGWLDSNFKLNLGDGKRIRFWRDVWEGGVPMANIFPRLFLLAIDKNCSIYDKGNWIEGRWECKFHWRRPL
ncbi:hypothetical protein SLEP1_g50641 [Rubroshorea leprosula]|uniref:DUF4283 domain-containing protein n=1 Tax=Rubroshorea leprosula TaxID=152421 RepID=A0AAV5M332_9ROSI|nr:hypothetical protein SLEP1_g50641 [Rubroshorea leprosula]